MVDDENSPSRLSQSLSARFKRKEQVARGEQVAETREEEEAALDDDQLLEKYGLTNPEEIEDEAGLEAFLENGLPDRLRQMALRRMWRLNPLFRFADEMVEYGENYTDAATVIDGMTTAYQVGKGYLQKAFDALDDEEEGADGALPDVAADKGEAQGGSSQTEAADARAQTSDGSHGSADEPAAEAEPVDAGPGAEGRQPAGDIEAEPLKLQEMEEPPRPRPQRMTFRRPAG